MWFHLMNVHVHINKYKLVTKFIYSRCRDGKRTETRMVSVLLIPAFHCTYTVHITHTGT